MYALLSLSASQQAYSFAAQTRGGARVAQASGRHQTRLWPTLQPLASGAKASHLQARQVSTRAWSVAAYLPPTIMGFTLGTVGYNLALSAWVCGGANLIGFAIATVTKTHYITDLIGCGTFTVAAWATQIAAMHGNNMSAFSYHRPLFLTIATTFWSVRLAGFLFYRVLCTKGDKRLEPFYAEGDEKWLVGPSKYPLKLLGFWSVQALWEFAVLLPVTVAQAARPRAAMGAWGWTGFALFMFFWAYETTADFQKDIFKNKPGNKGEFMRGGLYYFSQFPNYFAEIACWWAMFLWAGLPGVVASHPYIVISPIFTTLLLRFGSGVATLAPSQRERYGQRRDYQEYLATTPLLLPFMKPFYANREVPASLMPPEEARSSGEGRGSEDTADDGGASK